jgi:hypothetical protein
MLALPFSQQVVSQIQKAQCKATAWSSVSQTCMHYSNEEAKVFNDKSTPFPLPAI